MKGIILIIGFIAILAVFIATSFALWVNILLAFLSGVVIGWIFGIGNNRTNYHIYHHNEQNRMGCDQLIDNGKGEMSYHEWNTRYEDACSCGWKKKKKR